MYEIYAIMIVIVNMVLRKGSMFLIEKIGYSTRTD